MTSHNGASSSDDALRAAVLAAVEQYLAEEASAAHSGQTSKRRWPLRQPVRQPNLWRTLAWTNTRFRNSVSRF